MVSMQKKAQSVDPARVKGLISTNVSLSEEFAVASFVVLLLGSLVIGWWVAREIQKVVIYQTAITMTQFHDSFVSRVVEELSDESRLNKKSIDILESIDQNSPIGRQIAYFNLWGKDGRLVYSSDLRKIGEILPNKEVSPHKNEVANAWRDRMSVSMIDPKALNYAVIDKTKGILIRIFSPIHKARSDRILAVAEIYLYTNGLQSQIFRSQVKSWGLVGSTTLIMFVLLYLVVRRGSRTISLQQQTMKIQLNQMSELLRKNSELHGRAELALNRTTEINESFLRRISAELHDGPAQAISYTLLRLDSVFNDIKNELGETLTDSVIFLERDKLRKVLEEALKEIRNISLGTAMPELDNSTVHSLVQQVISVHEQRSKTKVVVDIDPDITQEQYLLPLKIVIYRFIQEALSNAFTHGKGINQRVRLTKKNDELVVEISDKGPGFNPSNVDSSKDRLGIIGMRERVHSIRGHFDLKSRPGSGTRVIARFPILPEGEHDD